MKKYWKYELFPLFLDGVVDCTFAKIEERDLTAILTAITKRAIEDFLFPKIELTYGVDENVDPLDGLPYGCYFINDVGYAEINVLLSYMVVYWVEMQINNKENFSNPFFDKDIKGYSPANMLKVMGETLATAKITARQKAFDYSRRSKDGKPSLGGLHGNG